MSPITRAVLWQFPALPATERCRLQETRSRNRLDGTVLTLLDRKPAEIRYRVTCDSSWRTRDVRVRVVAPSRTRRIELGADGRGGWQRDGAAVQELDGVLDIDLGFSPCTNTLPIRRLSLEVGAAQRIAVAWLRFPQLDLVRAEQVYTRLGPRAYRYQSGSSDFTAELEVDEHGIVTRYGTFWEERS